MITLEQKRAKDAWAKTEKYEKKHINFAKGLPALIMNSGLLQVLAFCHEKGETHAKVASDLCQWLTTQSMKAKPFTDLKSFLDQLMNASPSEDQAITTEAFAYLRWLRQMAGARKANLKNGEA